MEQVLSDSERCRRRAHPQRGLVPVFGSELLRCGDDAAVGGAEDRSAFDLEIFDDAEFYQQVYKKQLRCLLR